VGFFDGFELDRGSVGEAVQLRVIAEDAPEELAAELGRFLVM